MTDKERLEEIKKGINEVMKLIDKYSGSVGKPRRMTIDEATEIYKRLSELYKS